MKMKYKIGYISKISGVSPRALRFYEKKGLLIPNKDPYTHYRYYTDEHIDILQQVLLYRELGLKLDEIRPIIQGLDTHKFIPILEVHLTKLNDKHNRLSKIIHTVESTIQSMKGEIYMKNEEKFEGLKKSLIDDNDRNFKDEVIKKYGTTTYEKSNKHFKDMSKETFDHMNDLGQKIFDTLSSLRENPNSLELEKTVFELHKNWITLAWGNYNPDAHKGVAELYVTDERFTAYYDKEGKGFAKLLRDAIYKYA